MLPRQATKLVTPTFEIRNDKGMREEIEVELKSLNGLPFTGTITLLEAKHGIFRDCLGFKDFKNSRILKDCVTQSIIENKLLLNLI